MTGLKRRAYDDDYEHVEMSQVRLDVDATYRESAGVLPEMQELFVAGTQTKPKGGERMNAILFYVLLSLSLVAATLYLLLEQRHNWHNLNDLGEMPFDWPRKWR